MLLTTGIIALSRKVADEKTKRKEAKQGILNVGDSDVAKRAFASQTTRMIESGSSTPINRTGTDIKFEDPNEVATASPSASSPDIYSPRPDLQDARHTSQLDVTSPVKSEKGFVTAGSPYTETPTSAIGTDAESPRPGTSATSQGPPPYSPRSEPVTSPSSPSVYSRDTDSNTLATSDTKSIASRSTNSQGTHAIRVKSRNEDLKSGFPYHPALFDVHVHPDKWDSFTQGIIDATKFSGGDYARMVGAASATALTGAIGTSIYVGRSMNRSIQEKKIKAGLTDMSTGGLGDLLRLWNEGYFSKQGLFVHMELSESAMKNASQKSKTLRKPALMYSKQEDRERKREERKFVIVVTKLDDDGQPTEALEEFARDEKKKEEVPVEIGSSEVPASVAELPGEEGLGPVELPADQHMDAVELPAEPAAMNQKTDPPAGVIEMDSDNSHLLEKMYIGDIQDQSATSPQQNLTASPLILVKPARSDSDKEVAG